MGTISSDDHTLVLGTNSVAVDSDGYLLFFRDNKFAAQAFNPSSNSLHGQVLFLPDQIGFAQSWGIQLCERLTERSARLRPWRTVADGAADLVLTAAEHPREGRPGHRRSALGGPVSRWPAGCRAALRR